MDTAYPRLRRRTLAGMVLALLGLVGMTMSAAAITPLDIAAVGARPEAGVGRGQQAVWSWPLDPLPRVVHPFDKPPGPYAAGHRGMDLAGAAGQRVLAVDDGVVWHAGAVAGRYTVTIDHGEGMRSTYEPLTLAPGLVKGARVHTGQVIGTLETAFGHCLPVTCLHLGALRQGSSGEWDYVQPLFYLLDAEVILLPTG